ncbi:MAG TPA: polysaccharide deacetylase family protein [Gemmatimonadales bacterium]|nr:polysaccharide deacetylase family protein [Gemmatimonadales bacterium]
MGIEATFFVVGNSIEKMPDIPARVRALGHRLGNHTWTHFYNGLPAQLESGGDIVDELMRTAALFSGEQAVAFRPPYGAWNPQIAAALNADDVLSPAHVGPFNWEIHCTDWKSWLEGEDPIDVASCFRAHAKAKRKGIVLLHDYTAEAHNRPEPEFRIMAEGNRSAELTRALVPMLLADGFRFVPLAAVS